MKFQYDKERAFKAAVSSVLELSCQFRHLIRIFPLAMLFIGTSAISFFTYIVLIAGEDFMQLLYNFRFMSYYAVFTFFFLTLWNRDRIQLLMLPFNNVGCALFVYEDESLERLHRQLLDPGLVYKETFVKLSVVVLALSLGNPLQQVIVFLASSPEDRKQYDNFFIYPMWLPFQVDSLWKYVLTYSYQHVVFSWLGIITFLGQILLYLMYELVKNEVEALIGMVERMDETAAEMVAVATRAGQDATTVNADGEFGPYEEKVYNRLIVAYCQHYTEILRYILDTFDAFRSYVFIALTIDYVIGVVNSYVMVIAKDTVISFLAEVVFAFLLAMTMLFWLCHSGEYFTSVNDRFAGAFYNSEWYDRPLAVQNSVLSVMVATSFTIRYQFNPSLFFSYVLFGNAVRSIFSLINFLIAVTAQ